MTLANRREHGVRRIGAMSADCRHEVVVYVDAPPNRVYVPDAALRLRCFAGGLKAIDTRPNWREHKGPGRKVAGRELPAWIGERPKQAYSGSGNTIFSKNAPLVVRRLGARSWEERLSSGANVLDAEWRISINMGWSKRAKRLAGITMAALAARKAGERDVSSHLRRLRNPDLGRPLAQMWDARSR